MTEWEILERIDPWGQTREDWRAALIAWMLYTTNRTEKAPKMSLNDFLPDFLREKKAPAQSVDEQLETVVRLNAMFGGTDARASRVAQQNIDVGSAQ